MKLTQEDKKELAKTKALAKWVASEMPQPQVPIHKPSYAKARNTSFEAVRLIEQSYDQLAGEWLDWLRVAKRFEHKVMAQDRNDIRHDIILRLAQVARTRNKSLSIPAQIRVASYVVSEYWTRHYKLTSGLDCGHCSTKQRRKCRSEWLYSKCPKLIKLEYLSKPITDSEGNITELGELIADDKAIDLDAWLDAKTFEQGCPKRFVVIASKRQKGIPLNDTDQRYFNRQRQKELKRYQKTLF